MNEIRTTTTMKYFIQMILNRRYRRYRRRRRLYFIFIEYSSFLLWIISSYMFDDGAKRTLTKSNTNLSLESSSSSSSSMMLLVHLDQAYHYYYWFRSIPIGTYSICRCISSFYSNILVIHMNSMNENFVTKKKTYDGWLNRMRRYIYMCMWRIT